MMWLQKSNRGILLKVKVIPNAGKSEIVGLENDELKIRLAAAPEKGEANEELIRIIAKILSIGKSNVEVVKGGKSRHKQLIILQIDFALIQKTIEELIK